MSAQHNSVHYKTHRPLLNNLPHIICATININSLSAYGRGPHDPRSKRHKKVIKVITSLLTKTPVLCVQETNLSPHDTTTLSHALPNHTIYYNNLNSGEGGTMIIVHNSIIKVYTITHLVLTPGRTHLIRLDGTSPSSSINIINVHIPSNDLLTHISPLLNINPQVQNIVLGDFNFTEYEEDSPSSYSSLTIKGAALDTWNKVKHTLNLREIHQPIHTHYFITSDIKKCRTSRIDRIYASLSDVDMCLLNPTAYIPSIPHSVYISYQIKTNDTKVSSFSHPTDHLPIILDFHPPRTPPGPRTRRAAPRWLASNEQVINHIHKHWNPSTYSSPYHALDAFSKTVNEAVSAHFANTKQTHKTNLDSLTKLSISLKYLKLFTRTNTNPSTITKYRNTHPYITTITHVPTNHPDHIPEHKLNTEKLLRDISIMNEVDQNLTGDILPPSSRPSLSSFHSFSLDEIKQTLPATKTFLKAIRPSMSEDPTSDPEEMGKHLRTFWSDLWNPRSNVPTPQDLDKYLNEYEEFINPDLAPIIPDLDEIEDCINQSSNSSPGPDGIPFAFIRAFAFEISPLIRKIILLLAEGIPPPPDFNTGLLYLFPKKGTLLPPDHRPITVSNCINRIVAKLMASAITPAVQELVKMDQVGFIQGRDGRKHVIDITTLYYQSLTKREQIYILFLDTEKAFDSIDHRFIINVLKRIKMPEWLINVVTGLLHNVLVFPVGFSCLPIPILRGVKQGCPLSPLLFILCFEILLARLRSKCNISIFAYADDLAIGTNRLVQIVYALRIIRGFSSFSGLGINLSKTAILTSLPHTEGDLFTLKLGKIDKISFVSSATYLGILMGRSITTIDIYREAYKKLTHRVYCYGPILKISSLHRTIIIFNIFILPIMYYIAQFYIIPYSEYILPIINLIRHFAIPFNGAAYSYTHIITLYPGFGPHSPLRDLWAFNMTLLGWDHPCLKDSHNFDSPQMDGEDLVTDPGWDSMVIGHHKAFAAYQYLRDYNPSYINTHVIDTNHIKGTASNQRARLYKDMIDMGYWQPRSSTKHTYPTSLPHKISKLTYTHIHESATLSTYIPLHRKIVRKYVTPAKWNIYFRIITNSLPTDRRRLMANMVVPTRSSPNSHSTYPCYLCGYGTDSIKHLFTHNTCRVVTQSTKDIITIIKSNLTPSTYHSLLLFKPTKDPLTSVTFIYILWGVWRLRRDYFATLPTPPSFPQAHKRLTEYVLNNIPKLSSATPSLTPYLQRVVSLASNPPPNSLIIFTDGSRLLDHAGAGLWAYTTDSPRSLDLHISIGLGLGDNNLGEMIALHLAIVLADSLSLDPLAPLNTNHTLIFSDSEVSVFFLTGGYANPTNLKSVYDARRRHHLLKEKLRVYWVRGHTKIEGNEMADRRAKEGARASHTNKTVFPNILFHTRSNITDPYNPLYNMISTSTLLRSLSIRP